MSCSREAGGENSCSSSFHPFFSSSTITPHFPCFLPVTVCTIGDKNKMVLIQSGEKGGMLCQD